MEVCFVLSTVVKLANDNQDQTNYIMSCLTQDKRTGERKYMVFWKWRANWKLSKCSISYYGGNGIYKSIDGGLTWDSLSFTATNTNNFDSNFDFTFGILKLILQMIV